MYVLGQDKEVQLDALIKNSDKRAYTEIFEYYFPRILNYVHYRVNDYHIAEDLTSLIFERVFLNIQAYRPEKAAFSTWLFTIARNAVIDYYRNRTRTHWLSLDANDEIISHEPGPEEVAANNEMQLGILKALESLNQRARNIIALKFWSGMSNRDIARISGISESNTGVILFRAMKQLRVILERQGLNAG